ncbi:hypothetical protein GJ496_002287 [Pomphorhynchus laevis]|nr:hypothetical protein GJ496_002287 [Pomphorhynchus laevis]
MNINNDHSPSFRLDPLFDPPSLNDSEFDRCCDCKQKLDGLARSLRRYRSVNRKIILTDKLIRYVKKAKSELDTHREECGRLRVDNATLQTQIDCLLKRIDPLKKENEELKVKAENAESISNHIQTNVVRHLQEQIMNLNKQMMNLKSENIALQSSQADLKKELEVEKQIRSKAEIQMVITKERYDEKIKKSELALKDIVNGNNCLKTSNNGINDEQGSSKLTSSLPNYSQRLSEFDKDSEDDDYIGYISSSSDDESSMIDVSLASSPKKACLSRSSSSSIINEFHLTCFDNKSNYVDVPIIVANEILEMSCDFPKIELHHEQDDL